MSSPPGPAAEGKRSVRPRRRRPGRLRRWLVRPLAWLLLLLLVALSILVWYLYRPAVQHRLLARLIPRVEQYLGREVHVGRVRYSLYPLWLELTDVRIGGPRPQDAPILTARRVYVIAELRELRRPVLRLQEVRAEGLEVFLHRFPDGTDNWPRPRRRGPRRDRPYELDITSLTVRDGVFRLADDSVRVGLEAQQVRVGLLGMEGEELEGRVVAERVELRLPNARPYGGSVAGKARVRRDGMQILLARASSPELQVDGRGLVRWRGDKRVELRLDGEAEAEVIARLGYVEEGQLEGRLRLDGTFTWTPGLWGFRGELRAPRLRALYWQLTDVAASLVGDRNAVWADLDRAAYAGGAVGGWVEVSLPGRRAATGERAGGGAVPSAAPARDGERRTRLDLRLTGIDAERFLRDSRIPVGNLSTLIDGSLEYRFVEADWRHGSGVGELRLRADPRSSGGLPLAGPLSLLIDRGRVSADGVRLAGDGQVVAAAARYDLASERGTIDYQVQSSDLGPLAAAIPVEPLPDGGPPLWLPTAGRGELRGTLELQPGHVATELHLELAEAVARGAAAQRASGVVALSSGGLDELRLELEREGAAALIGGAIPAAAGAPWSLSLDLAGWPVEQVRPWLELELPLAGPFTGMVTLGGAGATVTGQVAGEVAPARLYELPLLGLRARLSWNQRALLVEQLVLRAPAGELAAAGEMALPGHQLAISVAASGLDPSREPLSDLLGGEIGGVVSFTGELAGTLERPALRGELVGERLQLGERRLGDDGRAVLHVDWHDGRLEAGGSLLGLAQLRGGGALDLEHADLRFLVETPELATLAALIATELPAITGSASGELQVVGALAELSLRLRIDRLAAEVAGTRLVQGEPLRLALRGGRLVLESVYLRGAEPGSSSELIVAGSAGLAGEEPLDLRLQGVVENRWLAPWLPWFELSGSTALLATVRGTASAPRINGQAQVSGARLSAEALPQPLEEVEAVVLFYPDRLVIDQLTGRMGAGSVLASGNLEWPVPGEPVSARFQIAARGVTLRWEDWQLRGDGELVWSIDGEQQQLRGLVTLDRAAYLRDVELGVVQLLQRFFRRQRLEVGSAETGVEDVQLNLQVRAPATVRIRNNLADVRASAELTLRGSVERPLLFGTVEAEAGGELVYAENTYRIERGALTFANPYRVEPLLDLVATTRVSSYDVQLSLVGNLERLQASFSSDPPLPELEVLSLLLSGSPSRLGEELAHLDPEAGTEGSAAEGMLLGQAASLVTRRVSSLFGFDAFRIEPLSRSGESVSSARVTVGKRLSRDLYVTYSYDPSSTGGQRFQVEWQMAEGLLLLLTQEQDSYAVDLLWERRF